MKLLRNICRILVGIVFIYSGFVKGVDPLGSDYKFTDYFNAFGMSWMGFSTLFFSFLQNRILCLPQTSLYFFPWSNVFSALPRL